MSNPTWDEKVDLLTEAATLNGKIAAYKEALRILDGIV